MIVLHALGALFTFLWDGVLLAVELPFHVARLGLEHPVTMFIVVGTAASLSVVHGVWTSRNK